MTDHQGECLKTPSLELTVENVQKLEQEFRGLDRLYGSSQSIEGYVKTTEHLLGETSQKVGSQGRLLIIPRMMAGT